METTRSENHLALRLIVFSGEALELQSLRPWIQRHGDKSRQLVNMYGITDRNWNSGMSKIPPCGDGILGLYQLCALMLNLTPGSFVISRILARWW